MSRIILLALIICAPFFNVGTVFGQSVEDMFSQDIVNHIKIGYIPLELSKVIPATPIPVIPTIVPSPTELLLPSRIPTPIEVVLEETASSSSVEVFEPEESVASESTLEARVIALEERLDKMNTLLETLVDLLRVYMPSSVQ